MIATVIFSPLASTLSHSFRPTHVLLTLREVTSGLLSPRDLCDGLAAAGGLMMLWAACVHGGEYKREKGSFSCRSSPSPFQSSQYQTGLSCFPSSTQMPGEQDKIPCQFGP